MRIFKYFVSLFILSTLLFLISCDSIDGGYVQLEYNDDFADSDNIDINQSEPSSSVEAPSVPDASTVVCNNDELVRVSDYITDAVIDMKYATADNFTGGKIYEFDDAYLRYGTVMKLKKAADSLRNQGYRILIWDAYRPQSAQYILYENASDKSFVANPDSKSKHSSGNTVDISLVKSDGSAVTMPTGFDDFSQKADRDYSDVSEEAGKNSDILEKALESAGFSGYSKEWWHYSDTDSYEYDDIKNVKPASKSKKTYFADCNEYINLRKTAESGAEIICQIPANSEMKPFSWSLKYIGVIYNNQKGYVSADYVK